MDAKEQEALEITCAMWNRDVNFTAYFEFFKGLFISVLDLQWQTTRLNFNVCEKNKSSFLSLIAKQLSKRNPVLLHTLFGYALFDGNTLQDYLSASNEATQFVV